MPIYNGIINQKGTPAFYSDIFANRPAFGYAGRVFISTDTGEIYEDTGTSWTLIADAGAGTTGTLQQVTTNGSSTTVGLSTSGNGIGIGTSIPASNKLDIHSASGINATFNGTTTTNAALQLQNAGTGKWNIQNLYNAGANSFQIYDVLNSTARLTILNTGAATFSSTIAATSATFSGGATFFNGGNTFVFSTNVLTSGNADGAHIRNVVSLAATPTYSYSGDTDTGMYSDAANTVSFTTAGVNRLTIGSTGAATFSGLNQFLDNTVATTSGKWMRMTSTGSDFIFGINNSTGGSPFGVGGNYSTVIGTNNATNLVLLTNGVVRQTISSTGAATFTGALSGTSASFSSTITSSDTITSGNGTVNTIMSYGSTQGIIGTGTNHSLDIRTNNISRINITTAGIVNATSRGNFLGATDNALFSLNSGGTLYTVGFSPNATANSTNTLTLTTAQTTWIYTGTGLATWTLPTPSGTNQMFWIKNAGTGIITLNAFAGTNIIDNTATSVSSITIAVGATVLIQQDGNVKSYQLQ